MDKNIFQFNDKGNLIKSWIKFWDKDAVALEISYPYSGLSLAREVKESQSPREVAVELSKQLFSHCQFIEKEMQSLKRIWHFNYQQEGEASAAADAEKGPKDWYDEHLAHLIPFELPPYTKMEDTDYIGKHRRPTMGGMVYLNRPDSNELIRSCKLTDLEKSDKQLIADYNMAQANGFLAYKPRAPV